MAPRAAPPPGWVLNASTVSLFTTMVNGSQSSRALGWDTNDYVANGYRGIPSALAALAVCPEVA